jgi:predicted ATPase with chaperone activity
VFLGELALNGELRHVPGVLPVAAMTRARGVQRVMLAEVDAPEATSILRMAMAQLSLSVRAFHRVLEVARAIGDLSGVDQIGPEQIAEALGYRRRGTER